MKRLPFTWGEKWLLAASLLAVVSPLAWAMWRTHFGPRLIAAPVPITKAFATPDGKIVAVGSPRVAPGQVAFPEYYIFDLHSGEQLSRHPQSFRYFGSSLSPDGRLLAVGEWNKTYADSAFAILDVANGFNLLARVTDPMSDIQWISNSRFLAWDARGSRKGTQKTFGQPIYEARTLNPVATLDARRFWNDSTGIAEVLLSPDGLHAILMERKFYDARSVELPLSKSTIGPTRGRLAIVSWPEKRVMARLPGDLWHKATWSRDGQSVVALATLRDGDMTLRAEVARFHLATRATTWTLLQPMRVGMPLNSYRLAFSPDGRFLASATGKEGEWTFWSTSTGRVVGQTSHLTLAADDTYRSDETPRFSPDGRYFLRPSPSGIELWDLNRWEAPGNPPTTSP